MATTLINALSDGVAAVGSDEFVINRAGTDRKLSHTQIMAAITAALAAEVLNRQNADTTLTNTKLNLAGGTMTGPLTLITPTTALHAATKSYVDIADALLLPLTGGTMTGLLTLTQIPTALGHAVPLGTALGIAGERWKNTVDLACNTNPDYPASVVGTTYRVSSAGRVGGASGKLVQVDDIIYCHTADTTGGTEALVGTKYLVIQTNLGESSSTVAGYVRLSTPIERSEGTDDTTAITPLDLRTVVKELVPNYSKTLTAATGINVNAALLSQVYLCTGTASGAVNVQLPQIASYSNSSITLVIKDAGLLAGTNNITINRNSSDTIDGATSKVISTNGGVVTLVNDGGTAWFTI